LFEFGEERLENPVQILNDIVVPDVDHAITAGAEIAVALRVFLASGMLAAVEFDNQAPLATSEVEVVTIDGLLADEFEAAKLSAAKARLQREFCGRECAPLSALLILAPQRLEPSASRGAPHPGPLRASGAREKIVCEKFRISPHSTSVNPSWSARP
jgi:hypothetical protein